MISAKGISFYYGKEHILKDINVTLEEGQITAVIGPSGAGKSTLLKALTLLELPKSGKLSIDDETYNFPITDINSIKYPYPKVNITFQQQFLWPNMTLKENILLPAKNIKHEKGNFTYTELVELFGMRSFIDRYPNEASLGQRQRVALARALITNPKYLFLDEITTFLDVKQVAIILSLIGKLKERGISLFIVTHHLQFARELADQVLFVDNGRIIEQGSAEILNTPKTKELSEFLFYMNRL